MWRTSRWPKIKTLNCDYSRLAGYPEQEVTKGNHIAELKDVFQLVRDFDMKKVRAALHHKQIQERNLAIACHFLPSP